MEKENREPNIKSPDKVTIEEKVPMEETIPTPQPLENLPAEPKPKKRVGLAIMLVILVLLLVGGALALGYLWGNNNNSNANTNTAADTNIANTNSAIDCQSSSDERTENKECNCPELAFSEDTIVNKQEDTIYRADSQGRFYSREGLAISVMSHGDKTANAYVDWGSLDINFVSEKTSDQPQTYEISFNSNVVDILAANFSSQAVGYEVFLFLLEDGTVEYMPLLTIHRTREVKSSGKLPGLANIEKFYQGASSPVNNGAVIAGGTVTAFAQSADGKIYQLYTILQEVGAWN